MANVQKFANNCQMSITKFLDASDTQIPVASLDELAALPPLATGEFYVGTIWANGGRTVMEIVHITGVDTSTNTLTVIRGQENTVPQSFLYGSTIGLQVTAATMDRWAQGHLTFVNVLDFGADPTGATVSTAQIQAAIDYQSARGGGKVMFPTGGYFTIDATLVANAPVLLCADVCGDDSPSTDGGGPETARPYIRWVGPAGLPMFHLVSSTFGNVIWGGGAEGIEWDGNALANIAVWLDNTKFASFEGKIRNVTFGGVLVNSSNGVPHNFSQLNSIKALEFIWGAVPACQNAHGLILGGNGVNVPSTQQQIGNITGLVYNGSMVYIGENDNCFIRFINGAVQAPGTGGALFLSATGAQGANHNVFAHVAGKVFMSAGVFGNRFLHYVSEGGGISTDGNVDYNGDLNDYAAGRCFTGHKYQLRKWLNFKPGDMLPNAVMATELAASQWLTYAFPKASVGVLGMTMAPDYDLANGVLQEVELYYLTSGTGGGNTRFRFALTTGPVGNSAPLVTPRLDFTETVPQGAQYVPMKFSFIIAPNMQITKDDLITLSLTRQSADPLDTAPDSVQLIGVRINYQSNGPDSGGSGTYYIPAWE